MVPPGGFRTLDVDVLKVVDVLTRFVPAEVTIERFLHAVNSDLHPLTV